LRGIYLPSSTSQHPVAMNSSQQAHLERQTVTPWFWMQPSTRIYGHSQRSARIYIHNSLLPECGSTSRLCRSFEYRRGLGPPGNSPDLFPASMETIHFRQSLSTLRSAFTARIIGFRDLRVWSSSRPKASSASLILANTATTINSRPRPPLLQCRMRTETDVCLGAVFHPQMKNLTRMEVVLSIHDEEGREHSSF